MGQVSPHPMVTTTSTASSTSDVHRLGCSDVMSMPFSAMTATSTSALNRLALVCCGTCCATTILALLCKCALQKVGKSSDFKKAHSHCRAVGLDDTGCYAMRLIAIDDWQLVDLSGQHILARCLHGDCLPC